jgi:1-deoxy-D-xylulose-5-phosphate synthase
VHIITKKGKGYKPAETDPVLFHGLGPFQKETGQPLSSKTGGLPIPKYSAIRLPGLPGRTAVLLRLPRA